MINKTKYDSYLLGTLPKGCQKCVTGEKGVLLITGICPENCFYCPISEQKKNKDVIYINEIPTADILLSNASNDDIFLEICKEIDSCNSNGIGITGGDPLAKLDRTVFFISKLKEKYGKEFHIHLYTPFILVTEDSLSKLYYSGLDEIRFQSLLEKPEEWNKILFAKKLSWDIGIEIPIFPDKYDQTIKMIDFFLPHVNFVNLNELELSYTNEEEMANHGYHIKSGSASCVIDSLKTGQKILKHYENSELKPNIHLCTARLKDAHQLKNRLLRRAENVKYPFDKITDEGLLYRGMIYLKSLYPSVTYKDKLSSIKKIPKRFLFYLTKLEDLKSKLILEYQLSSSDILINKSELCLFMSVDNAKKISESGDKNLKIGWMEEYPTYDKFLVELEFYY